MPTYNDARQLDQICSDLVFADWKRGINRALISSLANGDPPDPEETELTNFSSLQHTQLLHESRLTFNNGFFQQGQYITCYTDHPKAPAHKRDMWAKIVEKEANRPLIETVDYFAALRSKFALLVLHGIAPAIWRNSYEVIPDPLSVSDVLTPINTLVGFKNLPILVVRKSFTSGEFNDLVVAPKRDPGWNMPFVKRCMAWVDEQMKNGMDSRYNEFYNPEKWAEEKKQESGWYGADRAPTIDVFDIYCKVEGGWQRRIIIDSWSNSGPTSSQPNSKPERKNRRGIDETKADDFLFTSRENVVATSWQEILSCQYADLSAVAPFMHNSVRSLGWLTYAQCHVANRLMCRIYDSGFEQLMQYFQVNSKDDVQRALKVELAHMGFIDPTIKMIPAAERWQPNSNFIELVVGMNQQNISEASRGWTQQMTPGNERTEKTKGQYMAELQQTTAMVGAALNQAYIYQKFEDREIFRRLLINPSKDPLARDFRQRCLRKGVPEYLLEDASSWNVEHEKMMGQGNQTLEMMVATQLHQLMQGDPHGMNITGRNLVIALTHNPQMALELYPDQQAKVTNSTQEASHNAASLLQSVPVGRLPDRNSIEYIESMLKILGGRVQLGMKSGMVDPKELQGMQAIAQDIGQEIKILSGNKDEVKKSKEYSGMLSKMMNQIKAFGQRLQAAQKKQQQAGQQQEGGAGVAEGVGKLMAPIIMAKSKAQIKEAESKQKLSHKDAEFKQKQANEAIRVKANVAATDLQTAASIRREHARHVMSLEE